MSNQPQILLYNFQPDERTHAIRGYLNRNSVTVRSVHAPEFLESLGFLFGMPGFIKNPQFNLGGNFTEEMMVLKDFSSEQLDAFLKFFRQNGLTPVSLKAVLTSVTQHWNSLQLYEELKKEHEAMKK